MSNNKNKDRVSPANIIAVVAIAALGVLSFFGALFQQEDGTTGMPLIKAGAFTVGLGVLLFICIMAKTTEKEFTKWRIFEYVSLAAYLIVAVTCYKPFLQFFHVVQHKGRLQTMARNEIHSIDSLCVAYNENAQNQLELAAGFMKEYQKKPGQNASIEDGGLSDYMRKISNVENWKGKEEVGGYVEFEQENLDSLKQKINSWSLMDLSAIAYEMKDLAAETWNQLDTHIANLKDGSYVEGGDGFKLIPSIKMKKDEEGNDCLYLDGVVKFDIGECPETSAFAKEFRKPWSGFNTGVLVYILLQFLALLNYLLVRRSPIVQIRKDRREDDGGLLLDA